MGTVVWMIAGLAGCHGVPIARVAPAPNRPQSTLGSVGRAALLPATVAVDMPSEMSSIDPSNSSTTGTLTRSSAIDGATGQGPSNLGKPATPTAPLPPTPLLDAALVRAKSRGELLDSASNSANFDPAVAVGSVPSALAVEAVTPTPEPSMVAAASVPTPEPKPVETVGFAPSASPEELWREGVRKLVGLARSKQEQGQAGSGNGTGLEPWGLRARVLAWLAEPDIDPDLGQREADNVHSVLRALEATNAVSGDSGKARPDAHNRGDDVRVAVRTLEAKAPLELVDIRLCSKVERFGDFTLIDPQAPRSGDRVVIYCEVDGVHNEPTSGGFQTKLAGRMEIIPEAGGSPIILPLETAGETFPRRRRDYYIAYLKELPRSLAPGQYTLRLTLKDVFSDQSASRAMPLTIVKGKPVDASTPHELVPTL